jgi:dihydroorotate dehydrogenase electron transfer subunit
LSRYFKAKIADNVPINRDYNLLTFIPLTDTIEAKPGQFYMIGCASSVGTSAEASLYKGVSDPLLKRPFSLFRRTEKGFQILYRIKGKGTAMIRSIRPGSIVDVLGPLGNSYPMPAPKKTAFILAGGLGIASVFFLAERIVRSGGDAHIYYGARTETDLLMIEDLRMAAGTLSISTDDGSCGEQGCVTDVFGAFLARYPDSGTAGVIYACGPQKMLAAVSDIARERGIEAYISVEERMACGIGACLGCVIKTVNGYKRVCKEGPVFRAGEIVW